MKKGIFVVVMCLMLCICGCGLLESGKDIGSRTEGYQDNPEDIVSPPKEITGYVGDGTVAVPTPEPVYDTRVVVTDYSVVYHLYGEDGDKTEFSFDLGVVERWSDEVYAVALPVPFNNANCSFSLNSVAVAFGPNDESKTVMLLPSFMDEEDCRSGVELGEVPEGTVCKAAVRSDVEGNVVWLYFKVYDRVEFKSPKVVVYTDLGDFEYPKINSSKKNVTRTFTLRCEDDVFYNDTFIWCDANTWDGSTLCSEGIKVMYPKKSETWFLFTELEAEGGYFERDPYEVNENRSTYGVHCTGPVSVVPVETIGTFNYK